MFGAPTRIQSSLWKALPVLSITFGCSVLESTPVPGTKRADRATEGLARQQPLRGPTLTVNADGSAVSNCSVSVRADFDWFGASPAGSVPIVAMRKSLS